MDKQLPTNVVFKGDNGKYMAATIVEKGHVFMQFNAEDNVNPRCRHTIHPNRDGTIRIKSEYYGKFWRRSPNWIWADSDDNIHNRDTLFRPVKLGGETFALQNLGNGNYCHRLPDTDWKQNCLNASSPYIGREAYLKVEEAVLSRRIYGVEYRTKDAKIHNKRVITLDTKEAANHGSRDDTVRIGLSYTLTKERKWDSSVSMKFGVKTTIEAGIPEVASSKVEVESEFAGSYAWGESIHITVQDTTGYDVVVPPNKKVTVRLMATVAACDVPFSYYQEDVLTTGERVVKRFDDGIYNGVNSYDMRIDKWETNL